MLDEHWKLLKDAYYLIYTLCDEIDDCVNCPIAILNDAKNDTVECLGRKISYY